jgi:hypothetical protein
MAAEKTPRKTTTPNSGTSWASGAKAKAYITVQGHLLAVDGSAILSQRVRLVQPGLRAPTIVAERAAMSKDGMNSMSTRPIRLPAAHCPSKSSVGASGQRRTNRYPHFAAEEYILPISSSNRIYQSGKTAQEKAIEINNLIKDAIVNK